MLISLSVSGSPFKSRNTEAEDSELSVFSLSNSNGPQEGFTLHYHKSNLDGSMPSEVSIYYPAENRSESFKIYPWSTEKKEVYLVSAEYDLEKFCIKEINAFYVRENGEREEYAKISRTENNTYKTAVNGRAWPDLIPGSLPSFNFNFDLTDFNTMYRYLDPGLKKMDMGIIGLGRRGFVYSGKVTLELNEAESSDLYSVYKIGGEAFNNQYGTVKADRKGGYIYEFSIPMPTTAPYKSFWFTRKKTEVMTADEWNTYVTEKAREVLFY